MGRNHHRDEEAARRGNSGCFKLSSASLKPLLSLYIQDTFQKGASRDNTRLKKKKLVQYLEQTFREKHFSSRERQLEKPASGAAAAKGTSEGKRNRNSGYYVQWTPTGHFLEVKSVE